MIHKSRWVPYQTDHTYTDSRDAPPFCCADPLRTFYTRWDAMKKTLEQALSLEGCGPVYHQMRLCVVRASDVEAPPGMSPNSLTPEDAREHSGPACVYSECGRWLEGVFGLAWVKSQTIECADPFAIYWWPEFRVVVEPPA